MKTSVWVAASISAIIALWWLTAVRLHLNTLTVPAEASAEALRALFLARLICGAILLPRIALTAGRGASLRALLLLVALPWPLAITIACAAELTPWQFLGAELALASLLACIATFSAWARVPLARLHSLAVAAAVIGVSFAVLLFGSRGLIFDWILT